MMMEQRGGWFRFGVAVAIVGSMLATTACSSSSGGTSKGSSSSGGGGLFGGNGGSSGGGIGGGSGGSGGGTGTAGGSSGTTSSGGSSSGGSNACDQCVQAECSGEVSACEQDQACAQLDTCVRACSNQTCVQGCANASTQSAVSELQAAYDCADQLCATPCGATSGGSSGASSGGTSSGSGGGSSGGQASCGFTFQSASCTQCFDDSCCSTGQACANDAACVTLANCVGACAQGDQTCVNTCAAQAPASAQQELESAVRCADGLAASCGC